MTSELFGNIALASAITAGIIGVGGCAIKIINLDSKIGDILLWVTAFFAGVAGISFIVFVWLITVFGGHTCFIY
jgi:hypothetical protein